MNRARVSGTSAEGDKGLITIGEVIKFMGISVRMYTVASLIDFPKEIPLKVYMRPAVNGEVNINNV
jgi:hypothetical protein